MHNAKKGGEFGANGEWYKGGQFVADCEDTIKGKYSPKGPRKVCVAPYEWVVAEWDKFGIWGEIEHEVETIKRYVDGRSVIDNAFLSLPIECYDVNDAIRSRSGGTFKVRKGYQYEIWFKRHRAYYGTLLWKWLNGERLISEEELANLAYVCGTGRRCGFRGHSKCVVEDVRTIADSEVSAAFAAACENGAKVMTDEEYRASLANVGGYVGNVGEKINFVGTVKDVFSFEGNYGLTFVVKFSDDNGNVLVWFASNPPQEIVGGAKLKMVGTVKCHNERDNEKQTVVTRCKVLAAA